MSDKDTLAEEREAFEAANEAESENRTIALESLKFWRMGEQWPQAMQQQRVRDGRPVLTVNRGPSLIRQVVNDSRMNRPQIKVKGVDDKADPKTAEALEGLCRNIEYVSNADVAYDTAIDCATSMGWGYLRVKIDYEFDDSFDKGLRIQAVSNPFSVFGDPYSTCADSSDWHQAHVVEYIKKDEFRRKYKGAEEVDWDATGYTGLTTPWVDDDEQIAVCEAWRRECVKKKIYLLSDGQVIDDDQYKQAKDMLAAMGLSVQNEREAETYKVIQRIMTGAEILETNDWAGKYIPVIPVYGEEINVEGKRYFRSMLHHAQDAQRQLNYWKTSATELVALAPRVPFIGEESSFDADPNWLTANSQSHPYLMVPDGRQIPQRQPTDGGQAIGAMSQAMAASDDIKSIVGLFDASLGARSNETSGKAIMARQREGDVSTFHFIDNLSRGIRHLGLVLVDLIPKTYGKQKIIRILGVDNKEQTAQLAQEGEEADPLNGVYDLHAGRYDVAVKTGPSFTTRREEAAQQMIEMIRSLPAAAPILGPELVKALDLPNADKIVEKLEALSNPGGNIPPELQQQIEQGQQQLAEQGKQIEAMTRELEVMKSDKQLTAQSHKLDLAEKDLTIQGMNMDSNNSMAQHSMEKSQFENRQQPAPQQSPVSVHVPDSLASAIVPMIAEAVQEAVAMGTQRAMAAIGPIKTSSPRRVKQIVRGKDGLATHMIEQDEPEGMVN